MGIYETIGTLYHAHPILVALELAVLGLTLLIGILNETTFALEVLRMLVARVKDHLRKLFAAAREFWAELTTWDPPPVGRAPSDHHDNTGE